MFTSKCPRLVALTVAISATATAFVAHPAEAARPSPPPTTQLSMLGADISSLQRSEALGGVYRNESGAAGDAVQILANHGVNYARLRVWNSPSINYNNKAKLLTMATRVKTKGMKVYVDLHYSDRWADGAHQTKPSAWATHGYAQLLTDVYDYTYDICNSLKAQGTPPDMVSIGNEIQAGMLWPEGSTNNWAQLAGLLQRGYDAVKACNPSTLVMLHLADGGDNALYRYWFDQAVARGVQFDVIGLSYYSIWHGNLAALQMNMNDVSSRYNKPVVVAETAYPFTLNWEDNENNVCCSKNMLLAGMPRVRASRRRTYGT
jgi:arabinogalactan endo-1,4-beta-galactosidase